jgi:hypothetical protein
MLSKEVGSYPYNGLILTPHGLHTTFDRRMCFMSHDDYYNCIDSQDLKSKKYIFNQINIIRY